MPHSPLNKGHEANKDSIASSKAWKAHKEAYLKKPGGLEEYNREKGEFYYSPKHGKLRLIPTDDAEVKDKSGIEKWQLAPDRKSSALNQVSEVEKRRQEREADEPGETPDRAPSARSRAGDQGMTTTIRMNREFGPAFVIVRNGIEIDAAHRREDAEAFAAKKIDREELARRNAEIEAPWDAQNAASSEESE